jgi:hypothetical protein
MTGRRCLAALVAVLALHSHLAAAAFGRNLLSGGNHVDVRFDGTPLLAVCGDLLVFDTPSATLLKDGLCDPSAGLFAGAEDEAQPLQFLIPDKSVGHLVFASGDCSTLQVVNVVCNVPRTEALDAATGELAVDAARGRVLRTASSLPVEHQVNWNSAGPYKPLKAKCGDSIWLEWGGEGKDAEGVLAKEEEDAEHSLFYLPDGDCPDDWYSVNSTAVMMHELSPEGSYYIQLPYQGEFSMVFADSSLDGLSCFGGHVLEVEVSCKNTRANVTADEYIEDMAMGPMPMRPPPKLAEGRFPRNATKNNETGSSDDEWLYLYDDAPGPSFSKDPKYSEKELEALLEGVRLTPPAPAPEEEYYTIEEEEDYTIEDMAPAPAPSDEYGDDYNPYEDDGFTDIPRPKSSDEYDYYEYEGVPNLAPEEEPEYSYFYEELDTGSSAPGPAPVVKRIKRKSGEPAKIEMAPAPIPQPRTFANTSSTTNAAAPVALAGASVRRALLLGAGLLLALLL